MLNLKFIHVLQSDHLLVSVQFKDSLPLRGKGYWKLNCHHLHHDPDFIKLIKEKIVEFKEIHKESDCYTNIQWDALKYVFNWI